MSEDFDDTVTVPPREPVTRDVATVGTDIDDTIIEPRPVLPPTPDRAPGVTDLLAAPVEPPAAPSYYRFRFGERTESIALDRPCFVGRRPSAPRVTLGALPRLVRVPSPLREVSATHLEVRQVGGSVVVTDLRSTNGSIVMLPGSVPRKLRQGESVVVSPGTLVDIGDDNILQILPMQRLS